MRTTFFAFKSSPRKTCAEPLYDHTSPVKRNASATVHAQKYGMLFAGSCLL